MRSTQIFVFGLEFAVLLAVICMNCQEAVGNRDRGPGWVEPSTVERLIGAAFNISCTKNETFFQINPQEKCNIEEMYFLQVNGGTGNKLKNVIIENKTTIIYMVHSAERQISRYRCMCGSHAIMEAMVYVGTEPQQVKDFNCIGYDFQYMICNFSVPNNTLHTNYNVSYRSLDNLNYKYDIECKYVNASSMACNITNEKYREFDPKFKFQIDISNALANLSQPVLINNYDRMVPSKPGDNLVILNKTTDSICVQWQMKKRSYYIRKGLLWHVQVRPKNFAAIQREQWRNNSSGTNIVLCLDDLPYAGYLYELELRVRVKATDSVWSQTYTNNNDLQTEEDRPRRPPRITNGSFYVYSSDTESRVYWEDLLPHEHNGKDFGYVISEYRRNNTLMETSNIKVEGSSALIKNFSKNVRNEIFIRSHNRVNDSIEASRLEIMPIDDIEFRARMPNNIRNVYHPNNNTFMLTWEPPKSASDVLNYTVYWCTTTIVKNSECLGPIKFETVPSEQRSYEMKLQPNKSQNMGMAVSANFENFNTGMHYPNCIEDITSDLARMSPVVDSFTNSSLTVKWDTGRVCDAILTAYNLTYCEDNINDCHTRKIDKFRRSYTISDLKPYTLYKIKMLMYSKTKSSTYSDELSNRTDEAAPLRPHLLNITNITNTSAVITWLKPNVTNGELSKYIVTVSDGKNSEHIELPVKNVIHGNISLDTPIVYVLHNLSAFMTYTVSVKACTSFISEPSNVIKFKTKVGRPSLPIFDSATPENGKTILKWTEPSIPSGRLEYYEVWIREIDISGNPYREYTSFITPNQSLKCYLLSPKCKPGNSFDYKVSAVNVEPKTEELPKSVQNEAGDNLKQQQSQDNTYNAHVNELQCLPFAQNNDYAFKQLQRYTNGTVYFQHKSDWSTRQVLCSSTSNTNYASTFMPIIAVLIASAFAVHILWRKYNEMSDIGLKLPTGIETYYTKTGVDSINDCVVLGGGVSSKGGNITANSTNVGNFGRSQRIDWSCIKDECGNEHNMPEFMRPQTQLDGNGGNESAKLLLFGGTVPDARCNISPYIDEPIMRKLGNCSNSTMSATSPYIRMNSGPTVETFIDNGNNLNATKPFCTTAGGIASEYKNASDFLNTAHTTMATVNNDSGVGSSGYIKPANMLNLWHAATPAVITNSLVLPNSPTTTTSSTVIPISGYITVQSAQATISSKLQSGTEPSIQKDSFAMTPVGSPSIHTADKLGTSGYVQSSDLQKLMQVTTAAPTETQTTTLTSSFNPIQTTAMKSIEMPQSKPKPALASGYTTMEQLAVSMGNAKAGNTVAPFSSAQQLTQQTEYTTPTRLQSQLQPKPISGYVTQRDLNAFAQQQHHQVI